MSKVIVKSNRTGVLTLCGENTRCILHQGENKLDAEAWEAVKKNESVAKLLESKAVEELGAEKEKPKKKAQEVLDQRAPEVAEEAAEESAEEAVEEVQKEGE